MEDEIWFPKSNLFSKLNSSEKKQLIRLGKKYTIQKDQYVFQAHNPGKSIYLLVGGHAKVFHVSATGKEVILWFCLPGEVFGLAECLSGDQRKVYAQACSDTTVIAIPENEFNTFIASDAKIAKEVIELLSNRLRILSKTLLSVSTDDAESKVTHIINRLSSCYGILNDNELKIDFCITHQEIADMIGASRQTVTSTISRFKKQGLLFVDNHKIHLNLPLWKKHRGKNDEKYSIKYIA